LNVSSKVDYIGSVKFSHYYLQRVPQSETFKHTSFEVL